VGLLRELGYSNVRHLNGGIAEWKDAGLPVELVPPGIAANGGTVEFVSPAPAMGQTRSLRRPLGDAVFDVVDRLSTTGVFAIWLALILICGMVYWFSGFAGHPSLSEGGRTVAPGRDGLWTAIYFSFVTATSVGYGDVLPVGGARILAVAEAAGGLMIFGLLVAKFVSHRQDILVRQIHGVTFEERLDRLQTNLHLVVSELLAIGAALDDGAPRTPRIAWRLESTTLVFVGELRAIHHLLYAPQEAPDEPVLNAILANLSSALNIMREVLLELPSSIGRSPTLESAVKTVSSLAQEICADCVPQIYAPELKIWMDRVQQTARTIAATGERSDSGLAAAK
jgi:Ion channel